MRTFWHLLKFNLIFQKIRIVFLAFLTMLMASLVLYFFEDEKSMGSALMQYSSYILFVIFTGKLNARNSQMFDIKHLLAMPLSKKEIVITKSVADVILSSPVMVTFLWGFHLVFPEYHLVLVLPAFFLVLVVMNIVAFSKRIDFFRIQHSKSHLRNIFLYMHKWLELMIVITLVVIGLALILTIFKENVFMIEYSLIVLMIAAVFVASSNALKMLRDETLSYFIVKRDIFRMGWKLMLFVVPALGFHFVYKDDSLARLALNHDLDPSLIAKIQQLENIESKRFLLALATGDREFVNDYLAKKKPVPWDQHINGYYPVHFAVLGKDTQIVEKLIELKPEEADRPGAIMHSTPLFQAMYLCDLKAAHILLKAGANVNHVNKEGNTPLIYAAKYGCAGGFMSLLERKADISIANKETQSAEDFLVERKDGMYDYLIYKEVIKPKPLASRGLASTKESDSSPSSEARQQPVKRRQQTEQN